MFVGITHSHVGMCLPELTCGVDIGKERMNNHLNRLAVEPETAFGHLLKFVASRPRRVLQSCCLVGFHTEVPHTRPFRLYLSQAVQLCLREALELVDFDRVHMVEYSTTGKEFASGENEIHLLSGST